MTKRYAGFELEVPLGRGNEGTVYRARSADGQLCALKVPANNPATLYRLALEAANARWLASRAETGRFTLPFLGASLTGERYLAMALAEDGSLEQLARTRRFLADEAKHLANAAMDGVLALAAHGAWYADLRADNLVLAGGDAPLADRLRFVDFGAVVPLTPLLRYERWPYDARGALPPRGFGWVYAPLEASDLYLGRTLLEAHLVRGVPLVPIRHLRDIISGAHDDPLLGPPPELIDLLTRTTGPLCRIAERFDSLEERALVVRLPAIAEGIPEIVPIAVLEMLRAQSRFVDPEGLRATFGGVASSIRALGALARWCPLLVRRMGELLVPTAGDLALDQQIDELHHILSLVAPSPPVVIALCEGEPPDFIRAAQEAGTLEWIVIPHAPLFPNGPIELSLVPN